MVLKVFYRHAIHVQPNQYITGGGGGVICEDAQMVYMMIVDYRYHVKIVKNTFNNSIFLHRRDIQEPDVIVKPDGEYHMSFVWQDG